MKRHASRPWVATEAMLVKQFNRQFTVRKLEQFGTPRTAAIADLELPRGSILHYLPQDVSEIGPSQRFPLIARAEGMVSMRHHAHLTDYGIIGRPKPVTTPINSEVLYYHRINKRIRRLRDDRMITDPKSKVLLVENYAPLRKTYRYQQTKLSWYESWHNIFLTMVEQLKEDADKYERQNYLFMHVPTTMPAINKLRIAEKKREPTSLSKIRKDDSLFFLELWTWLGQNREHSMFNDLTSEQLKRVNILVMHRDRFINLNLGELDYWRKNEEGSGSVTPEQMQKRLYKSFLDLIKRAVELPTETPIDKALGEHPEDDASPEFVLGTAEVEEGDTDNVEDIDEEIQKFEQQVEIDENEEFEIVQSEETEDETEVHEEASTIDTGVVRECQKYINAGMMTTKEYERVINNSQRYKDIENPFGDGTLEDMLTVSREELKVEEEVMIEDDPTIVDPTMAKSTIVNFDKKYIENVLPKDIIGSVVSVQKAGVAVTDYAVDEVIDAAGRLNVHTLRLAPVGGEPSTIRFTTPVLDERGYWTANDIKYTMRKQRVDIPIRKTSPSTVAITSFYGKNFIRLSEKASADRTSWMQNQIVSRGLNTKDMSITNVRFSNVFDPEVRLPRDYTAIAQRLAGFTSGNAVFSFDFGTVHQTFGKEVADGLIKEDMVPIGKSRDELFVMDMYSTVYRKDKDGMQEVGSITNMLDIDTSKEPKEFTELSMMGKSIPLAIIFGFYFGLENALKLFNISYRVAESNERIGMEGDMVLALQDAKLVLTFDNAKQKLIFQGFTAYLKLMRDFTLRDMNGPDVYLNLIQKDKLTVRYLNELELMDALFVDPITERILKKMGEPTDFRGLLVRANEMLTYDAHPEETDMDHQHIFGTQRIAGAIYTEMVRGIRNYRNKPGTRKRIDIPSNEIWNAISSDPAVMPASDANPIHSIKEADVITFGGSGGRSRRSMVKHTRKVGESDLGIVSESTVDSGDVSITSYMVGNPIFDDLDGMVQNIPRDQLDTNRLISSYAALAPGALNDDGKRVNFIGIQHGSGTFAEGYEVTGLRTGFEKFVAHRTNGTQANIAEQEGKVIDIDDHGITVEYKDGSVKAYPLGRSFGRHEGAVFPHNLVSNVKVGAKFKKGDVLTYNSNFFEPDVINPRQVNWKAGVMLNTVMLEGTDTLEDSSAISEEAAQKLTTKVTKVKNLSVRFDQAVHNLVKVGDKLDSDSILCTIEDALTANSNAFGEDSLETLRKLSANAPKAKVAGVVDKIEIFYNGEIEDMSETIAAIARAGDRARRREAKSSPIPVADNCKVDSTLRIEGHPVELDSLVIRIYLTQTVGAIGGDKAVFANQMKTTFRRVMTGRNEAECGDKVDAIFGRKSIDNRIVLSVYQIGTTNKISMLLSERCQELRKAG